MTTPAPEWWIGRPPSHTRAKCTQVIRKSGRERRKTVTTYQIEWTGDQSRPTNRQQVFDMYLPPASSAQAPGVHLAHVTHANDPNGLAACRGIHIRHG
jgi:hypothetical protein